VVPPSQAPFPLPAARRWSRLAVMATRSRQPGVAPAVSFPPLVDLEDDCPRTAFQTANDAEERAFVAHVCDGVIGHGIPLDTPEGRKPLLYFDYIASGRFHRAVEDELNGRVLPMMANTHTETSWTGRRMTHLYERAFQRIAAYLNAAPDDVVLPVGSGSTGAVNRLIHIMGLRIPDQLEDRYGLSKDIPEHDRPVIFRSQMEHHSNDITWRETIGEMAYVDFDAHGRVSVEHLDAQLERYRDRPVKIGTFSAASNVTGIYNDCHAIARVLHRHGALAFFDFAAAGPYVEIDMHPLRADGGDDPDAAMDAVFLSMHKFLGGPRAPGLLIASRRLFSNRVPTEPGGGTVLYTSQKEHVYVHDASHRETGGTPQIVGSIQAGLCFDLKHAIGTDRIHRIEQGYLERALAEWRRNPDLEILGDLETPRLGVISMIFRGLHHNFAVALLSDFFGVQVRGGCMCAGPYGHELLHIDEAVSLGLKEQIQLGHCGVKPGWVRVSLAPVTREEEFQTLLEGVEFVCKRGRDHLDRYELVDETGEWRRKA
jgi:selenocysteine lyase/cysteine desulfurase